MTYEELNMGQGGDITDVHNLVDFIVSELIKVFSVCLLCYFSFTFLVLKWIKLSNIQFGKGVLVCLGCFNKNTVDWRAYQFSSVAQSSPTVCDPMDCSTPGLPVRHQLPEFTQTHVHWVIDVIQPSSSVGGVINNSNLFLIVVEAGKSKILVLADCLMRACFLDHRQPSSCIAEGRGTLRGLFYNGTNPVHKAFTSRP